MRALEPSSDALRATLAAAAVPPPDFTKGGTPKARLTPLSICGRFQISPERSSGALQPER